MPCKDTCMTSKERSNNPPASTSALWTHVWESLRSSRLDTRYRPLAPTSREARFRSAAYFACVSGLQTPPVLSLHTSWYLQLRALFPFCRRFATLRVL
jgi:hypothetical protein